MGTVEMNDFTNYPAVLEPCFILEATSFIVNKKSKGTKVYLVIRQG